MGNCNSARPGKEPQNTKSKNHSQNDRCCGTITTQQQQKIEVAAGSTAIEVIETLASAAADFVGLERTLMPAIEDLSEDAKQALKDFVEDNKDNIEKEMETRASRKLQTVSKQEFLSKLHKYFDQKSATDKFGVDIANKCKTYFQQKCHEHKNHSEHKKEEFAKSKLVVFKITNEQVANSNGDGHKTTTLKTDSSYVDITVTGQTPYFTIKLGEENDNLI